MPFRIALPHPSPAPNFTSCGRGRAARKGPAAEKGPFPQARQARAGAQTRMRAASDRWPTQRRPAGLATLSTARRPAAAAPRRAETRPAGPVSEHDVRRVNASRCVRARLTARVAVRPHTLRGAGGGALRGGCGDSEAGCRVPCAGAARAARRHPRPAWHRLLASGPPVRRSFLSSPVNASAARRSARPPPFRRGQPRPRFEGPRRGRPGPHVLPTRSAPTRMAPAHQNGQSSWNGSCARWASASSSASVVACGGDAGPSPVPAAAAPGAAPSVTGPGSWPLCAGGSRGRVGSLAKSGSPAGSM